MPVIDAEFVFREGKLGALQKDRQGIGRQNDRWANKQEESMAVNPHNAKVQRAGTTKHEFQFTWLTWPKNNMTAEKLTSWHLKQLTFFSVTSSIAFCIFSSLCTARHKKQEQVSLDQRRCAFYLALKSATMKACSVAQSNLPVHQN